MSKFLVTGGAGFIGSHLSDRLVSLGHYVRVLDNLSTGHRTNLKEIEGRFDWIEADAADRGAVEKAVDGMDGVFHLAAVPSATLSIEKPWENQRAGEVATLIILDAARRAGVKRVVHSSSSAVYGEPASVPNSEGTPTQPLSFYGLSKLTGEEYGRIFSSLYPEFDTVSLRYFNVFGDRQSASSMYSGVVSLFVTCLLEERRPTIFGDGLQSRDFIEVSDVVAANLAAMESPVLLRGESFNVGTGQRFSILDLWSYLARLADSKLTPLFAAQRAGDIRHSCADITKIQKALKWHSTDPKEGLIKFWNSAAGKPYLKSPAERE